jgi:hypothetical protein
MKNFIAISLAYFAFWGSVSAQMDNSVAPMSLKFPALVAGNVTEFKLPAFSAAEVEQFDYNDAKNGHVPHFARNIATNINLNNAGTLINLPGGGTIWRVQITAAGAQGLIPLFDRLYLPPGATLHVYMPGREETLGAFTHYNTPAPVSFCCGLIHGETCIIEYYEPAQQKGNGILNIDKVGYAYRWVEPLTNNLKSGSGPCEVNVACSEGDNWGDQIKASAMILIVDNSGEANCSGSMINNVRKDCTPYLLSANHCTESGVTDVEFGEWVFYFNYRGATCNATSGPQTDVVNGCQKMADSNDGDSATASDFLLVKLNNAPPLSFNIFYSGWDATNTVPDSGVCIGYPEADIEKISTYSSPAVSTSWGNVAQNTHWQVQWVTTTNGHGVTEPGSSGSPLYSQNKFIVGHLTGGNSCCTVDGCGTNFPTGPDLPDLFGKIAYDWTSDGVTPGTQLKAWLDPDNTGATTLPGMYPPCGSSRDNDAGIQAIEEPNGNICSSSFAPVVVLRNFGGDTLNSVTLNYAFDNGAFIAYPWSGNLLPGSTINDTLPTVTLTSGAHTFTVTSANPNGSADSNPSNDTLSSTLFIANEGGSLNLQLTTDDAGSKTTWQITDALNNVVASGGPYPDLAGGTTYNIPFCLPVACYTFTIFSSTGNGMDLIVQGNFVLSGVANDSVYASLTNPSFGSQEVHNFCILPSSVGITKTAAFSLSVIPNPSTGQFNVVIGNNDMKSLRVFDVTGRIILERKTAGQNVILDLSGESRGVYILQIETEYGKAVQKLVLK